jgi:2-hydroxychromene-2-carboxylate isomerase
MSEAVFFYDLSSPYAYLAAERIGELLPEARWQPIAFGALIRAIGKTPWSLRPETRTTGIAEVERRAQSRGLPPVRWPDGWPDRSYSLIAPRAALWASDPRARRALSLSLFRRAFVRGERLDELETVLDCAREAELDDGSLRQALGTDEIKERLRTATDDAMARGVTGVPTIALNGELYWGDDRLEDAAHAGG